MSSSELLLWSLLIVSVVSTACLATALVVLVRGRRRPVEQGSPAPSAGADTGADIGSEDRAAELAQEVLERVSQLDRAKTDFVSTVSHELRTPLTSIAGYAELLEEKLGDRLDASEVAMLDAVGRNVVRLRTLIEDLLTLSRTESGSFRTSFDLLDLTHLTSDVAYDLQASAEDRGITIHEVHPPRPIVMRGDAGQLSRALLNLVSNAVKFSCDGGEVIIRVRQLTDLSDGQGSDPRQPAPRHWAQLEVTDHGIGIPAGEMPALATRFFRASNAVESEIPGTGLGLRIVQAIAANHGGRLEMSSVEGEGTTARLVLPALAANGKKRRADPVEDSVGWPLGHPSTPAPSAVD